MSLFQRWSRALLVALVVLASGVGCQAVFGGFRIDDNAFLASMGAAGGGQSGPIRLKPTEGLYTTEWGGQATFYIVLTHQPTSPVTIGLSSSNPGEGKVSPASITFTAVDWRAPQRITVTGVPDGLRDGNQTYQIRTAPAVSDDSTFSGIDAADVTLVNIDAQTAGVTIAPISGLVTSESGAQDTFTVVLNSPPAKNTNVTIGLSSSNPKEGTVAPDSLVFTDVNWMAPQLVTVTGIPDGAKDGPQVFKILTAATVSTDPAYVGIDPQDVEVTNQDNDTAGLTVALVTGVDPVDPTLLRTSEGGDTATFTVALNVKPSADVTVAVASSLPSEGTISPPSLTFTQANWNAPQTVTVTGANDAVADGDQPYSVVVGPPTGDDADYAALMPVEVPAVNVDNDKPGFTLMLVSGIDPNDATKLLTTEAGTTATFTLALNSEPMSDVTVTVSSTSTTNEAAVSPGSLTFTRQNWQAPQLVTVTGLNDEVQDGSQ